MQVDHPLMAGQFAVQRDKTVALTKDPQRAVIDQHFTFGEAVGNHLDLLEIAGVEVAMLELANILQRFQAGDPLLQVHAAPRAITLTSLQ
ncbi:hypothetical protein D3C75_452530 [compost metagenome]